MALSLSQLRAIQSLGEAWMNTDVLIRRRSPYAEDVLNPYGDDTVAFAGVLSTDRVKGWLVPVLAKTVGRDAAAVVASGQFKLRLPVGTSIKPGDEVVIGAETYNVVDSTNEQSWPEWTTAMLMRRQ